MLSRDDENVASKGIGWTANGVLVDQPDDLRERAIIPSCTAMCCELALSIEAQLLNAVLVAKNPHVGTDEQWSERGRDDGVVEGVVAGVEKVYHEFDHRLFVFLEVDEVIVTFLARFSVRH